MIEVEKKFLLTSMQQDALLDSAQELGEKTVKDEYFDTAEYRLTINNLWFRKRNNNYELKVPLRSHDKALFAANRFHELTTIEEICQELNLNEEAGFESELSRTSIKNFMTCYTNRKSYTKQGFHIDIDSATYPDSTFTYAIAEIELLVDNESEADEAEHRIINFAKNFNLVTNKFVLGKVAAYLQVERPGHYKALIDAGVLE